VTVARLPSAAALLRSAEEATGLTDWGGDLFRQPFAVFAPGVCNHEYPVPSETPKFSVMRLLNSTLTW